MSAQAEVAEQNNHANNAAAYREQLAALNVAPLWDVLKGLVPNEPRPKATPHNWQWAVMRDRLIESGTVVSAEEAERRVLMLENPGLGGLPNATDTIYAGLQLILPGEIARAHRHTQSALRFVLEGVGGYTSVDGVRTEMLRGDFIVTPAWTWHDHGNDGNGPVMWLDGLDVPLVTFLRAGFREEYEAATQFPRKGDSDQVLVRYADALLPLESKHTGLTSPIFNYPYVRTREVLDELARNSDIDACHGVNVRYANPLTGGWAMPTIAASMRLIPRGYTTEFFQSVEGTVLVGVEGSPSVEIEGVGSFDISDNDVFVVPGWSRWRMSADASEDAVLFVYSDRPVYEKLGLYREKRG
ncbi:cupin domain-containing protein [Paraburkholderia sp. CNPSo 3281]|uniref:cupin domain-containing protein n=1 Tax=Paraburkholderia sp. CNPSo 3281 TaxID=2940933 RepID=UPI0020B6F6CE|nr:cupin domain-containing protein [Paraburkholderia sp. CNPSo 3281]MCP3719174.1 cupin domain-containing protein [Paraburkholderia sp. CNPSo 3281]